MGDVVPFRGKRRWTRPEDYGHFPESPRNGGVGGGGDDPPPRRERTRWRLKPRIAAVGTWIALVVILAGYVLYDPALLEPPAALALTPENVSASFVRCDEQQARACVIDGSTFRLGERRIRVIGIDAPKTHPARCDAEARAGERATAELQRLLNQGPFVMTGRIDRPTDGAGRELRALSRTTARGGHQSIADAMLASGTVRRYAGAFRKNWCSNKPD